MSYNNATVTCVIGTIASTTSTWSPPAVFDERSVSICSDVNIIAGTPDFDNADLQPRTAIVPYPPLPPSGAGLKRFKARAGLNASGQRSVQLGDPLQWNDPAGAQDFLPRDWMLERANWIDSKGRISDLPVSTPANPIRSGTVYVINQDIDGEQLDRLVMWDENLHTTGPVAVVKCIVPAGLQSAVIAEAANGSQFNGEQFVSSETGLGCIFDAVPNNSGEIICTVTTPGTGYRVGEQWEHQGLTNIGDSVNGYPIFVVDSITGDAPHGGWRYLNHKSWVKELIAESNQDDSRGEGDFLSTVESGKKELYVFHNGSWQLLFGEQEIKQWIAGTGSNGIITALGGIQIGGNDPAHLLDEYEEGTFTAKLSDDNGNESSTTSTFKYTKIGRFVHVVGSFDNPDMTGLDTGVNFSISLPFLNKGGHTQIIASVQRTVNGVTGINVWGIVRAGQAAIGFSYYNSAGQALSVLKTDQISNLTTFRFMNFTYITD